MRLLIDFLLLSGLVLFLSWLVAGTILFIKDVVSVMAVTNAITLEPLRWCEYCKAAEDTAKLMKLRCTAHRHSFTLTEKPGERDMRQRTSDGRLVKKGWNADGRKS